LTFYYWHRLNHRIPFLWRFHNVHHIDIDLDVSTALRFHFGEITLSILFRVVQLAIIGPSPTTFLIFETCFEAATEFHHSNWRMPFRLERLLNKVFVTPRMHSLHHSVVEEETNSNYSTIFSWWDRLNRSFRIITEAHTVTIGVPAYRDAADQGISRLLTLPFQKQRSYWRSSIALKDHSQPH
jgi:sterol desaturase/sphingolipid hydroxylase (fatty acid hydroxylase superfamily)